MRSNGFTPTSVTVAGGATKSPLWLQIHADVSNVPFVLTKARRRQQQLHLMRHLLACGLPFFLCVWECEGGKVERHGTCFNCRRRVPCCGRRPPLLLPLLLLQVSDAPALGCAILAAVAGGLHPDVPTACTSMVHQVGGGVGGVSRGWGDSGAGRQVGWLGLYDGTHWGGGTQIVDLVSFGCCGSSNCHPFLSLLLPACRLLPAATGPHRPAGPAAPRRVPPPLPGLQSAVPRAQARVPRCRCYCRCCRHFGGSARAGRSGFPAAAAAAAAAAGAAALHRVPQHPVSRLLQP